MATYLDRARLSVAIADEQIGDMDPEQEVVLRAAGIPLGALQERYLRTAQVFALISIAESLERIAGAFAEDGTPPYLRVGAEVSGTVGITGRSF